MLLCLPVKEEEEEEEKKEEKRNRKRKKRHTREKREAKSRLWGMLILLLLPLLPFLLLSIQLRGFLFVHIMALPEGERGLPSPTPDAAAEKEEVSQVKEGRKRGRGQMGLFTLHCRRRRKEEGPSPPPPYGLDRLEK